MTDQARNEEHVARVELRCILAENGLDDDGASPHSWRCEHPDRYPGACTCVAEIINDILAAGYRKHPEPEWEYAIHTEAGEHVWPLGPYDEELVGTEAECVEALNRNDPDFWDASDRIVRRVKAGPWVPVVVSDPAATVPSDG